MEQDYLFDEIMESKFSALIEKKVAEKASTVTPNQLKASKHDKELIKALQDERNRDLQQSRESNREIAELQRKLDRGYSRYDYKVQKAMRIWRKIAIIAVAICAFLLYAIYLNNKQ